MPTVQLVETLMEFAALAGIGRLSNEEFDVMRRRSLYKVTTDFVKRGIFKTNKEAARQISVTPDGLRKMGDISLRYVGEETDDFDTKTTYVVIHKHSPDGAAREAIVEECRAARESAMGKPMDEARAMDYEASISKTIDALLRLGHITASNSNGHETYATTRYKKHWPTDGRKEWVARKYAHFRSVFNILRQILMEGPDSSSARSARGLHNLPPAKIKELMEEMAERFECEQERAARNGEKTVTCTTVVFCGHGAH